MIRSIALPVSVLFLLFSAVACGGPDDDLRGWKQSDVEIVSEGAATGTTSRIVTPGDAPGGGTVALTSTDVDTTGLLETIPQDTLPDYEDEGNGTLADRLGVAREDGTMPPVRSQPTTTTTRPATSAPSTTTARPAPSSPSTTRTTTAPTTTRTAEPVREQRESETETRERETRRSEEREPARSGQSETEAARPAEPADPPAEPAPPAQESSQEEERSEPPPEERGEGREASRGY
jgi:hypothetical protein